MEKQFATFYLGEERFAVDILLVKEINRHLDITDVAGAPQYIRGLLNLRGQIVTVLDLAARLGSGQTQIDKSSRCIVLKTSDEIFEHEKANMINDDTGPDMVGLLVDRIDDMIVVESREIAPKPANLDTVDAKYCAGVISLENELIVIISAKNILTQQSSGA